MTRTVYVNGEYLPESEASISIFDRGFLFADAVYEVSAILDGRLLDNDAHLARLQRSLAELELESPVSAEEIVQIQRTLVERNQVREGMVYLQISRGAADRDFAFPAAATPTLIVFTQARARRVCGRGGTAWGAATSALRQGPRAGAEGPEVPGTIYGTTARWLGSAQ